MAEAGGKKQADETFEDEYFEETTTVKPKRGSRYCNPTNLHKIYSVKISMLKFLDGESPVTLATLNMALSSR